MQCMQQLLNVECTRRVGDIEMRAVVIPEPLKAGVENIDLPVPDGNEVLIKVMASGVCGTDVHIYRGEYLGDYPVVPGHEFSGTVDSVGSAVTRFKPGDRVAVEPNIACDNCEFCLTNRHNFCANWSAVGVTLPGGMAQYVKVPEKAVFHIDSLSFIEAAFVEPLSCVIHGVKKLDFQPGWNAAVVGAGPIGILLLQCLKHLGAASVSVVDRNRSRADSAAAFGADRICYDINDLKQDGYDAVIDATGVTAITGRLIEFAGPGRSILLFGVPNQQATVSMEAFTIFRKGLRIVSSYTSERNSYQAIELLKSGNVQVRELVSHTLSLDEFTYGMKLLTEGDGDVGKVMLLPNG